MTDQYDRLILEAAEAGFGAVPARCVDGSTWWWRNGDDCLVHAPGHIYPWVARVNGETRMGATAAMAVGSAIAARLTP